MKKLLLILLSIFLFSCNNNYKKAEELYESGIIKKSKDALKKATLLALKVKKDNSHYNEARLLIKKIDSVNYLWNNYNVNQLREINTEAQKKINEKRKNDSLSYLESEHLLIEMEERKKNSLNDLKNKLKKEDKKYPNLIARWILNEKNYLSALNSVVRIYKINGKYYKSMIFAKDKSESKLELLKISSIRYNVIGKSDYCMINTEGDLEFWDKQGYLLTCIKTN
mgnify:CR=1 FL=1|tara:strand:+ start:313 stop:987 length:675 start_codon:yes stop_codon:yes gene_type:complete